MTEASTLSIAWPPDTEVVHGTAVSVANRGLLIVGPSGSGKSSLGLMLLAYGAALISDDRTVLSGRGSEVMLSAPQTLPARIEARGVGLLHTDLAQPAPLKLVVDMGQRESKRLPPKRFVNVNGHKVALLHGSQDVQYPAALLLFMKGLRG